MLINVTNVRRCLLDEAALQRPNNKLVRVSASALTTIDAACREACAKLVRAQARVGKTIR